MAHKRTRARDELSKLWANAAQPSGRREDEQAASIGAMQFVSRIACVMLRNREDAEDACQETLIRAILSVRRQRRSGRGGYDTKLPLKPWLSQIAVNVCKTIMRKNKSRRRQIIAMADLRASPDHFACNCSQCPDPIEAAATNDDVQRLDLAITDLDSETRLIVYLKVQEDFENKDIARVLGCGLTKIKKRYRKGRLALARCVAGR